MDYKEKIIALLDSKELSQEQKEKLELIFPELKEDERNIKNLIDELKRSLRAAICQNHACGGGHEKRIALLEWGIDYLEKQGERRSLDADKVIEWLGKHIQVDEPKIEYNEDGQPLAESFIAHAEARCMAADKVVKQFKKDFGL